MLHGLNAMEQNEAGRDVGSVEGTGFWTGWLWKANPEGDLPSTIAFTQGPAPPESYLPD